MSGHTTRLVIAGEPVDVVTDGTQAAHTKAVTAAVRAGYARRIAYLEKTRDDAKDAYFAAEAAVPGYGPGTDLAERHRLRDLAFAARHRWQDAERVLTGPQGWPQDGAYSRLKPRTHGSDEDTPQQARLRTRRPRPVPRPATAAFHPGSWVGWDQDGVQRRGVVVSGYLPDAPVVKNYRHVLPDDGGDPVCIGPGFARTISAAMKAGRWEVYGRSERFPTIDTYTRVFAAPAAPPD